MEKVIRYMCDYCGELFSSEELCLEHEESHRKSEKANEMLSGGRIFVRFQHPTTPPVTFGDSPL